MIQRKSCQTGTLWKCLLFLAMTSLARGMERDTLTPTFNAHQGATTDDEGGDHMSLTTDKTRDHNKRPRTQQETTTRDKKRPKANPKEVANYSESLNAAKSVRFGGGEELAFYQGDPATLCKFDPNDPRLTSVVTIPDDRDVSRSMAMAKILKTAFRGEKYRRFGQHIIDLLEQNNIKEARAAALEQKALEHNALEHKAFAETDELEALITALDVDINLAEAYTVLMNLRDDAFTSVMQRISLRLALLELDVAFNKHKELRVHESSLVRKATDARDAAKVLEDLQLDACLDRIMKGIASMKGRKKNVDLRTISVSQRTTSVTNAIRFAQDLAAALELPFEKATRLLERCTPDNDILFAALEEAQECINLEETWKKPSVHYHRGSPLFSPRSLSEAAREAIKVLTADEISAILASSGDDVKAAFRHLIERLKSISAPPCQAA